jgi:hypothetical protein
MNRLGIALATATACAAPAALRADEFHTIQSRTYRVTSDADPALARQIASHMDLVNDEYHRVFAHLPSRAMRTNPLFVFAWRADYSAHLARQGINGAGSGGMFYDKRESSGLATFLEGKSLERAFVTLQHEGFHQFARFKFGSSLPAWANEGLADYFGEGIVARGRLNTGHAPVLRIQRVAAAIRAEEHLPLATLLNLSKTEWNRRLRNKEAGTQYDQSWSVVHFLYHGGEARKQAFEAFLADMAAGQDYRKSFDRHLGWKNVPEIEAEWKRFMLALQPSPVRLAQHRLGFLASGTRYLMDRGRSVASLDDLKQKLRSANYSTFVNLPGKTTFRTRASTEANFQAPASDRAGPPARLVELPASAPGWPPSLLVEGLAFNVRLNWSQETDSFAPRITFE